MALKADSLARAALRRAAMVPGDAAAAARVVATTGLLGDLSVAGVARFARAARGQRLGPHLAFLLHAKLRPDHPAVIDPHRRLTYGALDAEINQIAHALSERGIKAGDRVALMLPNIAEHLAAQLALARLGAPAVEIGYRLKAAEIAHILEDSRPAAMIVHASFAAAVGAARELAGANLAAILVCGGPADLGPGTIAYTAAIAGQPGDRPPAAADADHGGAIVYTSGTTGKPKGAARSWRQTSLQSVADLILTVGMRQDERHLIVCPLYHSAAPAFASMLLSLGATLVIRDHFDPEDTLSTIAGEGITSAVMVPTMLYRLATLPEEVRRRADTSSLRWVMSAAAPLPTATAATFQDAFGPILWNFYGSTETGLITLAGPGDHASRPGTCGRGLRGNDLVLLDEGENPVAPGQVGELYARNGMLITGYHNRAGDTAQAMRAGYFSVGDLARCDADGYYYIESRKTDMVISGGVNIYPREIEDCLHSHPEVAEAAVIGVPDPEWGESLKAFIALRPGAKVSAGEIAEHCRSQLADYKRPRHIVFVDELPRNPTGKVLKRELRGH